MWMRVGLLVMLLVVGLISIGEPGWAMGLAFAFVLGAVGWELLAQPLFVARMPTCERCGCPGSQFEWIAMRQLVGPGTFDQKEGGWVLASIDHLVAVPVEVPQEKGGVLRCKCRYWFRSEDFRTCWLLHEKRAPTMYAKRRWGRWLRV